MKILLFGLGFLVVVIWMTTPPSDFETEFQARTGIHPDSFLAAGRDCEAYHKRPCRLINGWTPR